MHDDDDCAQPSTSNSSDVKDSNRHSKFDRLVKKVGRKLLPRPCDTIFVPSAIQPCGYFQLFLLFCRLKSGCGVAQDVTSAILVRGAAS